MRNGLEGVTDLAAKRREVEKRKFEIITEIEKEVERINSYGDEATAVAVNILTNGEDTLAQDSMPHRFNLESLQEELAAHNRAIQIIDKEAADRAEEDRVHAVAVEAKEYREVANWYITTLIEAARFQAELRQRRNTISELEGRTQSVAVEVLWSPAIDLSLRNPDDPLCRLIRSAVESGILDADDEILKDIPWRQQQ